MVNKQAVLQTIQTLPDSANWTEICDALLHLVAREGSAHDLSRLYLAQLTPEALEEYAHPKLDISLGDMIQELEAQTFGQGIDMTSSPGSDPFRVSMSAAIGQHLRRLSDQAMADRQLDGFLTALRHIDNRLRNDPFNFGEELFDLRQPRATVKMAIWLPIVVDFGVYPDQRIVLIRGFRYLAPPSRSSNNGT